MAKQPRGSEKPHRPSIRICTWSARRNPPLHQAANGHAVGHFLDRSSSLRRIRLAEGERPGRRRHRHRRVGWRLAAGRRQRSSPHDQPAGPQITDVSVDGTTNSPGGPRPTRWRWRSISRSPAPPITSQPASPPLSAFTGRRTSPTPLQRQRPMAAMSARSPGARTRRHGVPRQASRWRRPRARPPRPGWWCSPRRATTISAMAGRARPMSTCLRPRPTLSPAAARRRPQTVSETVWNDNPRQDQRRRHRRWLLDATFRSRPGRRAPCIAAWARSDGARRGGERRPKHRLPDLRLRRATVVGGTSAVAPLYAGLFAAFGTKLGFIIPNSTSTAPASPTSRRAITEPSAPGLALTRAPDLVRQSEKSWKSASNPRRYASRLRNLLAENAVLRTLVAGKRDQASAHGGPYSVLLTANHAPGLAPMASTPMSMAPSAMIPCPDGYRPAWDMATQRWICAKV